SDTDASLDLTALPLLPGTVELIGQGIGSTLKPANDQVLSQCQLEGVGADEPRLAAATDPQTSGGLLFAIAPQRRQAALTALAGAGVPATVIGVISVKNHKAFSTLRLRNGAPC